MTSWHFVGWRPARKSALNAVIVSPYAIQLRTGHVRLVKFNKRLVALLLAIAAFAGLILFVRHLQHKQQAPADARGRPGTSRPAGSGSGPGAAARNAPVAVAFATVSSGDIQLRIPAIGTVTTLANVTVRTQISGTLQKILFTEGQLVHAGDVIAQIDPRPYEAALQTAQGNLRRDQALLADARLDLTRYEGLVKEDSIAVQQLDTQRALVDQYVGTIESDEGQVKTAQVNLSYTRIVSPVTGRVGTAPGRPGQLRDARRCQRHRRDQPAAADQRDLLHPRRQRRGADASRLHAGAALTVEAYDRANTRQARRRHAR